MREINVLKQARALIEDERNWCQGFTAMDQNGMETWVGDDKAARLDLTGSAIRSCPNDVIYYNVESALQGLIRSGGCSADFNDTHTHAEVIALIDETIARLSDSR